MSTVQNNAVSSSLLATMNPAASTASASGTAATEDRFLKLLVTQMKNQDPLNPLDNAQVTSQLAQLSTVTGIDKLNTTLQAMMASQQSNQSLQAASMIGHGVLVPGSSMALHSGQAVFGIELTEPADSVQVTIRDSAGSVVQQMNLGAQPIGSQPLSWNGQTSAGAQAADGAYTFAVAATHGGVASAANSLSFGQVSSVSTGAQGAMLNLPTLGSFGLADVRQII